MFRFFSSFSHLSICSLLIASLSYAHEIKGKQSEEGHNHRLCGIVEENSLAVADTMLTTSVVTREDFNRITDELIESYRPFAEKHGASLIAEKLWQSSTVNAYATQNFRRDEWKVTMHGGIARYPGMTDDAFAAIVCHELGHHFGGFPLAPVIPILQLSYDWAAVEGQADYYTAHTCLRSYWEGDLLNLDYAKEQPHSEYPYARRKCQHTYAEPEEQGLCIRVAYATKVLADVIAEITNQPEVQFETPDQNEVGQTQEYHPLAQCRLDTYFSAALCPLPSSKSRMHIPAKGLPSAVGGQNSAYGEREAAAFGCSRHLSDFRSDYFPGDFGPWGYKPRCWFKPRDLVRATSQ